MNAPVPVQNAQQISVHKAYLSIGSFSIRLVNGHIHNNSYSKKSTTDKEITPTRAVDNTWFSTQIIQATRAFSKTTRYTHEFGFLPFGKYNNLSGGIEMVPLTASMSTPRHITCVEGGTCFF